MPCLGRQTLPSRGPWVSGLIAGYQEFLQTLNALRLGTFHLGILGSV